MANKKLKLANTKYAVVNMSETDGDNTNSLDPLALFTTAYADKIIESVDFGGGGGTGGGDVTREQFNNEVQARKDGDATLTTKLNKEIQDRENADTTLQNNIDVEKTARENADTTLQGNIDVEKTARENADTNLQNNIDDEISARTGDIENVNSAITTERDARISADNATNQKLTQETTALSNKVNKNTSDISSLTTEVNSHTSQIRSLNSMLAVYWKTIYPIGSIYISTSATFNPNTVWGGTWEQTASGRCLIGANDEYPLGSTGGEKTHTLLENELPKIEGNAMGVATYGSSGSGHFKVTKENPCNINGGSGTNDLSKVYFGFGNNLPHNNMQPYLAVYMWKRTA